jgi:hypothetical protein
MRRIPLPNENMRDVEDYTGISNLESDTGAFSNEKVMGTQHISP